jgi:hypothetical protein
MVDQRIRLVEDTGGKFEDLGGRGECFQGHEQEMTPFPCLTALIFAGRSCWLHHRSERLPYFGL